MGDIDFLVDSGAVGSLVLYLEATTESFETEGLSSP
jgi:hypothetical protein